MPTSSPSITLLYFAAVRTSLPDEPDSQIVSLPSTPNPFPLSLLRSHLTSAVHPNNEQLALVLDKSAWSVNEEMVDRDEEESIILKGGEVVCAIPPVSGG
ncbi:hypothetical protein P7C70_g5056, partial [Phenoliferia sp. Uapishka_3]